MQKNSNQNWDAIVIGAGLGGLSSAAYLAACGKRTLLLERHSILGGSSHVYRRKKKWEFDCGVHYIGDCGPDGDISTLMRGLGLDQHIEWLQLDPEGFDTVIAPDMEIRTPAHWDEYLENLIRAFPKDERGLRYYMSVIRRIGENIDHSLTLASNEGWANLAKKSGWAAPWIMAPHISLMMACRLSPKAILTLSLIDGAVATTPQVTPVGMVALLIGHFVGGGAWYPRGGGQILSAGFAEVIQSHGSEIRTQTEVERIQIENGAVKGVVLKDGEILKTNVVVAAGDIKRTYNDLVGLENLPSSYARRVKKWKMAPPVINACFGINMDVSKTLDSNFYVIPNWDMAKSLLSLNNAVSRLVRNADTRAPIEWAKDFATNQPGFVQCSTRRELESGRTAPVGHAAIEVQTMAPSSPKLWGFDGYDIAKGTYRRNSQYAEIKEIITEGMLNRIERAYPGASAKVEWAELGTPASQERFTFTSDGAAMGLEPRISQFGPFRPKSKTKIKGLFVAGTSTVWGPGTAGSMLSGLHAASAITGRDLQAEIRSGAVLADNSRFSNWNKDFDAYKATRMLGRENSLKNTDEEEAINSSPIALKKSLLDV
ncbi:NAD(P)/FAD-dependent oxidoreductase [Acinetobacter oleivorans]|uniref:phytoene desaturase family protein n=1 Tax=Acinetobacter oleivorans TaxID=1148157 RepID=UPI000D325B06|nr:NAD(P)/FAD-dependent oxidoreductase [Acinetobacter oleivorans]PTV48633.1 NAD(P)/FAD-dependent oxidoreductase [Acinetobacter oleivorans]